MKIDYVNIGPYGVSMVYEDGNGNKRETAPIPLDAARDRWKISYRILHGKAVQFEEKDYDPR